MEVEWESKLRCVCGVGGKNSRVQEGVGEWVFGEGCEGGE